MAPQGCFSRRVPSILPPVRRLHALLASAVVLALGCAHPGYPQSATHPLLAHPLPDIHHRSTLDGQPFDSDQLAGKPVLIKFFADYCKPCKETLPAAERVHEAHPDVLFVGIDEDESVDAALALVQRYTLTFPVIHDAGNVLSGRFRVSTMPMTFVADGAGTIRWVGDETQTEDQLKMAVEAAR
jgi:cytochrome c biogenesis protein CcmG/thiol:disulfide interchange protein DsbE